MTLYLKICSDYELGETPFIPDHINVFRGDGFTVNTKRIKALPSDIAVLSNDETIMTMEQFFKKDPKSKDSEFLTGEWDIYYWRNNKWMKLQDCTERELRFAHNLTRILLAGGFDD